MGKNTNIEWCDHTWNVAVGCAKVDKDCLNCYMYRDSLKGTRWNPLEVRKTTSVFNLPLRIKEPSRIFTSSLTDLYIKEIDPFRNEVFDIIRKCPQHTFQLLTKRSDRIEENTPSDILQMPNVWFGTSCGSQNSTKRIESLLKVNCKVRFVSFEPLYEPVDMNFDLMDLMKIHWAIIGGESGNNTGQYRYRPCKIEWIESLITELHPVMPVFVKQLGTHLAKELKLKDRHGKDWDEWPEHLRIREFPSNYFITNKLY